MGVLPDRGRRVHCAADWVNTMANGPKNTNSLLALVAMVITAVIAVVTVFAVRPDQDNTAIVVIILGFVAQITAAILSLMKTQETLVKAEETKAVVEETHGAVNGQMGDFKATLKELAEVRALLARREGEAAGKVIGAADANVRSDELNPPRGPVTP